MVWSITLWMNFKSWVVLLVILFVLGVGQFVFPNIYGNLSVAWMLDHSIVESEAGLGTSGSMFFSLIMLVSFAVFIWSRYYMGSAWKLSLFLVTLFLFVSSMIFLVGSKSLLMVFIGWEGLGITSFLLIVFYQNWMSVKGGLFTLLTNRIGDAILLLCFSYWIGASSFLLKMTGLILLIMLFSLTITKSAQWPYTNWLPAAMAAPTPVSALVHSSTLVTAGIWVLIRYSNMFMVIFCLSLVLGLGTLVMASLMALFEVDAKKLVALSTLSQLGLMFISFSLGSNFIVLFHIITHALAKANLFLTVGNLLHLQASQQDSRILHPSMMEKSLFMASLVSVSSLVGLVFFSGFYSKEAILMKGIYGMSSSLLIFLLLLGISALTLAYCVKLVMLMTMLTLAKTSQYVPSVSFSVPLALLSLSSIAMGISVFGNFLLVNSSIASMEGFYWALLLVFLILLTLGSFLEKVVSQPFLLQSEFVDLWKLSTAVDKACANMQSYLLEPLYLTLFLGKTVDKVLSGRMMTILLVVVLVFMLM